MYRAGSGLSTWNQYPWASRGVWIFVFLVITSDIPPGDQGLGVESSQAISLIPLLQGVSAKLFFAMGDAEANKVQSSAILANLVA